MKNYNIEDIKQLKKISNYSVKLATVREILPSYLKNLYLNSIKNEVPNPNLWHDNVLEFCYWIWEEESPEEYKKLILTSIFDLSGLSDNDKEILIQLNLLLNGDFFLVDSYLNDRNPVGFALVEGFVVELTISKIGLFNYEADKLLELIGKFTRLRSLDLSRNEINSDVNLDPLTNLLTIKKLWLDDNNLEVFPECVLKMPWLEALSLDNNNLSKIPSDIAKMNSLKILTLDQNNLNSLPEGIGSLTSLKSLGLNENELTALPESFGNLKKLKFLHLKWNQFSKFPKSILSLESLEILSLNNNDLKTLPKDINKLRALRKIFLYHNDITSLPKSIELLPNLEEIHFDILDEENSAIFIKELEILKEILRKKGCKLICDSIP